MTEYRVASNGQTHETVPVVRLRIPLWIATGQYEHATEDQLAEHYVDIQVELERRVRRDGNS